MLGVAVGWLAAALAAAPLPAQPPGADPLPVARTWSDRGVSAALATQRGPVRVRLLLRDQPLLAAAADPAMRASLQTAPTAAARRAAATHPRRITAVEKAGARAAESSYEGAVADLQPYAAASEADLARLAERLERRGVEALATELVPAAVVARVPAASLGRLARIAGVAAIAPAPRPRPQSSIGWQAVGAPDWFAAGLTGGSGPSDTVPADAGVSSEIPDPTHPAFAGVAVDNYAGFTPDDHGTHTASIIASQDSINRGVAYGVDRLVSGADGYQLGFAINGNPAPPDPVEVINFSFGAAAISDNENDNDDITTAFFGVSQALAASNENIDGSPTVANIGRNTISVAALNDFGTVTTTDDVVTGFSSRGPTPGGRKKPDLIAPGGSVVAADAAWNTPPSNDDYTPRSGTSFASPHVAGAMTLLEGAGITDPMAQRALLINSARDWNGAATGLHGWTAPQTGWRPEVGWGILDLTTALAQRSYYRLGSVSEGEATFYRATVPAGSKATMAFQLRGFFTGYPGPPYPVGTTKYTVSNLDLHQYDGADAEITPPAAFDPPDTTIDPGPDAIDPNDTVEQVRSPAAPGTQQITYKVQSTSTIEGAAAEPFAIAAAAPLTPLAAPTVRPNGLAADATSVRCGQPVTITATARNDSPDLDAADATLGIDLPAGLLLTGGSATQQVSGGTLPTSTTSASHSWTVEATSEGSWTVTVEGTGDAYGTSFRDADQISFDADCTPPATAIDSGPANLTNDPTPTFSFSATGSPASFECSLDGAAFSACDSPFIAAPLANGPHSFRVRAIDGVGNVDPTPASSSFTVDDAVSGARLSAGRKQPLGGRRPAVRLLVALGEPGVIAVRASVRVGARKVKLRGARLRLLRPRSRKLRLTADPAASAALADALERGPVRLAVSATFADALGNATTRRRVVSLRG